MSYVVFFALLLLIALLAAYLVIEKNRRIAEQLKKQQFNERVVQVKQRLKNKLLMLVEQRILKPKHLNPCHAIVGNFFVVQPHSDEKLELLEEVVDLLISTFNQSLLVLNDTADKQVLADKVQLFVDELPQQGRLYNHAFYSITLPNLINNLLVDASEITVVEPEPDTPVSNEQQSIEQV